MNNANFLKNYIKKIFIEHGTEDYPLTKIVLSNLKNHPFEVIKDAKKFISEMPVNPQSVVEGKREILITKQKGRFFKPCPGTKYYLCCLYKIIHAASNCPIDCSYCVLQKYLNNPYLTLFANEDDLFAELNNVFTKSSHKIIRVGTGEFTDSMALEPITEFSKRLIPFVKNYNNVYLELKTKSTFIENVFNYKPDGHIFMAWSLNPPELIEKEEIWSASLDERLDSAKQCQDAGFPICFHFDPIIKFVGWQSAYKKTIEKIFLKIDYRRIVWISLGCLRFPPDMKNHLLERYPDTKLLLDETIIGTDGKIRYFKPVRVEIFKYIYNEIKKYAPDVLIYLCMESSEVWKNSFGFAPKNNPDFSNKLDERCKIFGGEKI